MHDLRLARCIHPPKVTMMAAAALLSSASLSSLLEPFAGCQGGTLAGCPSVANTSVRWIDQYLDHFDWAPPLGHANNTYRQRYFTHTAWWKPGGPILFYFGNEDNVELYVNHTGLMWEAARPLGAALVFAEHRYYGQSKPFAPGTPGCMVRRPPQTHPAARTHLLTSLSLSLVCVPLRSVT